MEPRVDSNGDGYGVMVQENETFESLVLIVKTRYLLPVETAMVLTFQFPKWMLVPEGNRTPPIDIATNSDVEFFMSIRAEYAELSICVTVGAYHVGLYRFQRRSPTVVGCSSRSFRAVSNVLPGEERQYQGNISVHRLRGSTIYDTCGGIDDSMVFWKGLLGQGLIQASERVVNEMFNPEEVTRLKAAVPPLQIAPPPPVLSQVLEDDDGSSTGSSDDVGIIDAGEVMPGNNVVLLDEDLDILEQSVRIGSSRPVTGGTYK